MSTLATHVVHDVLFEFSTPLACIPSPVACQITGMEAISGNSEIGMSAVKPLPPFFKILTEMSTT